MRADFRRSTADGTLPEFLSDWPGKLIDHAGRDWLAKAHPHQLPPAATDAWTIWLMLGGRGAGKTRAGAEWVRGMVANLPWLTDAPARRIALVGDTFAAVRDIMIEGDSGLLAIHDPGERPTWSPSLRKLEWPSGAVAHAFSSEDPEALRGPQFDAAWCDELAKWRHAQETWDMLQFGLRLGVRPREIVTTTPRPIPLLRRLLADPAVAVTKARTADNAMHLAPTFLDGIVGRYAGTRLGRQELEGELIDDRPDALWNRERIEACRVAAAPPLARVVVAVDPPVSSGKRADACGIVAAGVDAGGTGYVLEDATVQGLGPQGWAARAIAVYHRLEADALVVETNQGGEMAIAVLREVDPTVPVTSVHARRGKYARAEPVSVRYGQGGVRHVGGFPELEDEMCDFGPGGLNSGRSPDRLDALVWALHHLMLTERAPPRVRML